jgi:hypothetical protein
MKVKRVWNGQGVWHVTTWRERKKGGKRKRLRTRLATPAEEAQAILKDC